MSRAYALLALSFSIALSSHFAGSANGQTTCPTAIGHIPCSKARLTRIGEFCMKNARYNWEILDCLRNKAGIPDTPENNKRLTRMMYEPK